MAKGIVGGTAVDKITEVASGKNFGQVASEYMGLSPEAAAWLNPGYLLGGVPLGITKAYKNIKRYKQMYNNAYKTNDRLKQEWNAQNNKLNQITKDIYQNQDLQWQANHNYRQQYNNYVRQMQDAKIVDVVPGEHNKIVLSETPDYSNIRAQVWMNNDYPIGYTIDPALTTVKFLDTEVQLKPLNNASEAIIPQGATLSGIVNSTSVGFPTIFQENKAPFSYILEGDTKPLQRALGKYIDDLQAIMGDDGAVAGSLISYRNGIIKGTETPNGFIGPADTEIYTTARRYDNLVNKLQFKGSRRNMAGGFKGTSPYTFRNNDPSHYGVDTEINIIESDGAGMATGKVAHQIYRALWPEKYSQLTYDHTMSGAANATSTISLPITAEELLQTVRSNPEAMQMHLLTDLVGMETFTNPRNIKATKRLFSALFNPDDNVPQLLAKALKVHGRYNLGSQFKLGTELYPNLTFTDVEANKRFLMQVFKLSEKDASQFASNQDIMKNAFNIYNFSMSTGTRMVGNDVITDMVNGVRMHNPQIEMFTGNGSFGGGTMSGYGLNTALLRPFGGWRPGKSRGGKPMNVVPITQRPLTYYPEKIRTPEDLIQQVNKLQKIDQTDYAAPYLAEFPLNQPIKYDLERMNQIREISKQRDEPVILNLGLYGLGYSGGLAKPIASGARVVSDQDAPELGSLLKDLLEHDTSGQLRETTVNELSTKGQKLVQKIQRDATTALDKFKARWKESSLQNRGAFVKGQRTASFVYPGYDVDFIHKPVELKSKRWLYEAEKIQGKIRYERSRLLQGEYDNDEQLVQSATENLKDLNAQWSEFCKNYKKLRTQLYELRLQLQAAEKKLHQTEKRDRTLRRNQAYASQKLNNITKKQDKLYSDMTRSWQNIHKNKDALKVNAVRTVSLGLPFGLAFKLMSNRKDYNKAQRTYVQKEFEGITWPSDTYYYQLLDEGKSKQEARQLLQEARERYYKLHPEYTENLNK